jgi:hypothetical protein
MSKDDKQSTKLNYRIIQEEQFRQMAQIKKTS